MKTIYDCYDGYFKRLWNNTESYTHEVGFEEEYKKVQEAYKALSNSSILATEKGAKKCPISILLEHNSLLIFFK